MILGFGKRLSYIRADEEERWVFDEAVTQSVGHVKSVTKAIFNDPSIRIHVFKITGKNSAGSLIVSIVSLA